MRRRRNVMRAWRLEPEKTLRSEACAQKSLPELCCNRVFEASHARAQVDWAGYAAPSIAMIRTTAIVIFCKVLKALRSRKIRLTPPANCSSIAHGFLVMYVSVRVSFKAYIDASFESHRSEQWTREKNQVRSLRCFRHVK